MQEIETPDAVVDVSALTGEGGEQQNAEPAEEEMPMLVEPETEAPDPACASPMTTARSPVKNSKRHTRLIKMLLYI